jgi:hypothetical protein
MPVFKTGAFNRSANPPKAERILTELTGHFQLEIHKHPGMLFFTFM